MAVAAKVLVVATVTAESDELLAALTARAERGPIEVTLLMPATEPGYHGREACRPRLESALERLRAHGIAADGVVGDMNPVEAVLEVAKPGRFDEVIVSTLTGEASRWLRLGLPRRVEQITDLPTRHVVSRPPAEPLPAGPPPHREPNRLGPLSVLAWAGRDDKR